MATKTKREICTDFLKFADPVSTRFAELSKHELFVTDIGDALYDLYLAAFPAGTNPMFRQRTEHDCSACKNFIRNLGKVVAIVDGKICTVWGNLDLPYPYSEVAAQLDAAVKAANIVSVFRTKERRYGVESNVDPKTEVTYRHFHGQVASKHHSASPQAAIGATDAIYQVLKRGLEEFKIEDLRTVREMITSNQLYRGQEHLEAVKEFTTLVKRYREFTGAKDIFLWTHVTHKHARFRNTVIGTLLVDLAEGVDIERAVKSFETKVAPMNYKRPTALITQSMVEKAVQTLTDLGLHGAISRRFAKLSDVSVNDVLFVDNDTRSKMKDGITALLEKSVVRTPPHMKTATPITADAFLSDVLPAAKALEVFVDNKHLGNFVSLTGADGPERLFKWDNNFAWSYDGDVTDSVKQRVKAAGGNVNCKLRVSLSWFNGDDLDLHAKLPLNQHVFFGNKCGILDVDMNAYGPQSRTPVENLAFNNLTNGKYEIYVNQFRVRETIDVGFSIEVEYDGKLHQYSYPKAVRAGENVPCFTITVKDGEVVEINSKLEGSESGLSREKWGLKTRTFVPVDAVMFSPNHWGNNAVGAKHLIFALRGCKNPEPTRGIFNEFLRSDLEQHRKVFEVLGAKTKCAYADEQISGLGFTAARGDSVTVVVDGKRAYVVSF